MTHAYDAFAALAERSAYQLVHPPVLQPADLFLDLIGEDIRRRAFVTSDAQGREFCLRPDFTIPVCLHYLKEQAGKAAAYAYWGPVFRFRTNESSEFIQSGFENFGRRDAEAADAEILALALEAASQLGLADPVIRMGDAGLVEAMLDALRLPALWRRRLSTDLRAAKDLDAKLVRLAEGQVTRSRSFTGFLATLEGADHDGARAAVMDLLAIAGIEPVGRRSIGEIADRFLEQATLSSGGGLPRETIDVLRRFFAIAGNPDRASQEMRALAGEAGLDMAAAFDRFDLRTGFMAAMGIDVARIRFSPIFGRGLDYYTGMMFELHGMETDGLPLVGGGRYDHLLGRLGAASPILAVGCSVWIDRFPGGRA